MEANKKKRYYQTSYIDGTAVRKLNTLPEFEREREQDQEVVRRQKAKKKPKPRRQPAISFGTFAVLTAAIGVTIIAAVSYLNVQTEMNSLSKRVVTLETQIDELTQDNNIALNKINSTLDLEKVFTIAVNELGMVFPNNNQVVTYESAVNEYVRQHDKIPETNAKDLLDKIMK